MTSSPRERCYDLPRSNVGKIRDRYPTSRLLLFPPKENPYSTFTQGVGHVIQPVGFNPQ